MKIEIYNLLEDIKKDLINLFPKNIQKELTPKNLLYRFINTIIFSWFLGLYVYIIFLAYMGNYKFFSYDFFENEGNIAMNIISLSTAYFLILISLLLTGGFVIFFIKKNNNKRYNQNLKLSWNKYLMGLNIIFIFVIVSFLYATRNDKSIFADIPWILFLIMISIFINFHIVSIFLNSIKTQLLSTILLIGFLIPFILFTYYPYTSQLLSISLKTFGINNSKVNIINTINKDIKIKGELIFLSPKNIYLIDENKKSIIIGRKNNMIKYIK